MDTMLSSVWTIFWTIVNILILYLLLKKFLFGPINKMMDQRQAMIKADLDNAATSKAEADELKTKYEASLTSAKEEAKSIITKASVQAEKDSADKKAETQASVDKMVADAKKEIDQEKKKSLESARNEIAEIALDAAKAVMSRDVNSDDNERFIKEFLSEEAAD